MLPWLPLLEGDVSKSLHVLKTAYQKGQFQMLVEGRPDLTYEIRLWTPWRVVAATSDEEVKREGEWTSLRVSAPAQAREHRDKAGYVRWTVEAAIRPD